MAHRYYTISVDRDLKIPLRKQLAEEEANVSEWVSNLIWNALKERERANGSDRQAA